MAAALAAGLASCASMAAIGPAHVSSAVRSERVFVASTREGGGTDAAPLSYFLYEVSVPLSHRPGQDPRTTGPSAQLWKEFAIVEHRRFQSGVPFARSVAAEFDRTGSSEILVFVHGFNTGYVRSIVRMAQLGADLELPAAQVLYAWPSGSRLSKYVQDTERAHAAAEGLGELLGTLSIQADRIVVVGYSMGAATVVDAVKFLQASDRSETGDKFDIVLLAPDIDAGEFRKSADALNAVARSLVVYGSREDWPLKLVSDLLADGLPRLGALPNPEVLAEIEMTYVDVSNVAHLGLGHFAVASAPALISAINAMGKPDIVEFATQVAPNIPGSTVTRHGSMTYVVLPHLEQ